MAFRGRKILGSYVTLSVLCRDGVGDPLPPDEAPLASIYGDAGHITTFRIPPCERAIIPGYFQYGLFLGPSYSVGVYSVVYSWHFTTDYYGEVDTFTVIPSGNHDGSVISMHYYERPGARFLVQQLDSGKLIVAKNPHLG